MALADTGSPATTGDLSTGPVLTGPLLTGRLSAMMFMQFFVWGA